MDDLIPDGFADSLAGGYVDLPYESASADPQPLAYDNLPGVSYDPAEDWRSAQKRDLTRRFGEFGPQAEEVTDG